jgi:uncharacterized membrane-anchored protein
VRPRALKVPEVTALFWVAKATTTALGESTSDLLVHSIPPVLAVLLGFVAFCVALGIQFALPDYRPWAYWLAVAMVGVFGTMAADVLHVGFGIAYAVSTPVFAVALAVVFVTWYRVEGTLSMHSITTTRREIFYWLAVVGTFALGTAAGDLTAVTLRLGYLESAVLFAAVIGGIATSYHWLELNAVVAFWAAYVLTRPLGASVADWLGLPNSRGGVGVGTDVVSLVLAVFLALVVGHLQTSQEMAIAYTTEPPRGELRPHRQ